MSDALNRSDLQVFEERLLQRFEQIDGRFQQVDIRFDRTIETMRDIETNLLTEFHRYAKGQTARLHALEVNDADLKIRIHQIEERLLELEPRIRGTAAQSRYSIQYTTTPVTLT